MNRDCFTILGLAPGHYDPAEIARRFLAERTHWLEALHDPHTYVEARRRLEELHLAYAALRDPQDQADHLRVQAGGDEGVTQLRKLIAASLEDGLLRYSRRQAILEEARGLGLSDFQTQLLIAQVQFGDEQVDLFGTRTAPAQRAEPSRVWAGVAAAGVLAVALFLVVMRWLSI